MMGQGNVANLLPGKEFVLMNIFFKKKHAGCIIQLAKTVYGGAWMDDVHYPFNIYMRMAAP